MQQFAWSLTSNFLGKIWPNLTKLSQICQSVLPSPLWWGKKKYFGKILLKVEFSHQYKHTVKEGSESSMEMEPKHCRAIFMRTLALKNLQTHCFHSQDTSRRKEERPEGNHICKKPEAWEDSWQTSMQVLARNSTNQFK